MKRVLIVVLVVAVLAGAGAWVWSQRGKPGHEVVFTWDHARGGWEDCSATVHRDCLSGFTLTDVTDSEVITSAIPADARSYTWRPGWEIELGFRHIFTLTANASGSDGLPIRSEPATVVVENPAWKFGHAKNGAAVVK
ncbi:MAG TPA: hypothetical protein VHX13_01835 [Acidobacteriaceae bacterium]|jgi:hypothetical protein|nr:hypothetical protein [Acidobacteriaceae bacterium]